MRDPGSARSCNAGPQTIGDDKWKQGKLDRLYSFESARKGLERAFREDGAGLLDEGGRAGLEETDPVNPAIQSESPGSFDRSHDALHAAGKPTPYALSPEP